MITYIEVNKSNLDQYDSIPMLVHVDSIFQLEKHDRGLGGITLKEIPCESYIKDLGVYAVPSEYPKRFDITHWRFFMAFDGDIPVGGATLVCNSKEINMLDGRYDLCVLWDIRVHCDYKKRGIGKKLFDMTVDWSCKNGFKQLKIECQNNNVNACRFYHKQGAVLGEINEYAYYTDPDCKDEVQFIWYLDL